MTTPVRTRRTGPMSLRLPLSNKRAARPSGAVLVRARIARLCPPGRKPWRYIGNPGDYPVPAVTLTQ